jgi:AcrR family transcriptional regulator
MSVLQKDMPKIVDAALRRAEVAESLFRIAAVDGLERASLREVADEAGLAVGSVRHYFSNHDELTVFAFGLLVDRIVMRLQAGVVKVENQLRSEQEQHEECVVAFLEEALPLEGNRRFEASVWLAFITAARTRPRLRAEADRCHRGSAVVVGKVIMALLKRPGIRAELDPVAEAERLLAVMDGLTLHSLLQPGWTTAQMCRSVLRAHLRSLA